MKPAPGGQGVDARRGLKLLRQLADLPAPGSSVWPRAEGVPGQWGKPRTVATPGRPRSSEDGSIVVACIEQNAVGVLVPEGVRLVTRRRITVRVRADGVMTLREARILQGRTASGGTYARWVTNGWASARTRASDGAVVFTWNERARNYSPTKSSTLFAGEHPGHLAYEVLEACGLERSRTERRAAYPLVPADATARGHDGRVSSVLPHQLWTAFAGTEDVGEVTRTLFGTRRYRKDLVRAVAGIAQSPASETNELSARTHISGPWGRLALAWAARGLVELRRHLRALDEHSVHRLLTAPVPERVEQMARDVLHMSPHPGVRRVRGWRDLHDQLCDVHARDTWAVQEARACAP